MGNRKKAGMTLVLAAVAVLMIGAAITDVTAEEKPQSKRFTVQKVVNDPCDIYLVRDGVGGNDYLLIEDGYTMQEIDYTESKVNWGE